MMNERRRKRQILKVDHYDGQCIYSGRELLYELGGYLGGGAAGVVYEAFCAKTKRHVAIKILNPVGYKLLPSTLLTRCVVAVQGKPLMSEETVGNAGDDEEEDELISRPPFHMSSYTHMSGMPTGGGHTPTARMRIENVWWLVHPTTKQAVAAFEDPRTGMLRELSLPQCIDVWGTELDVEDDQGAAEERFAQLEEAFQEVQVKNQVLKIPRIPKKFIKFARTRRSIHREVANMSGLDHHENVLRLEEALELVQDSKCTTFLVLELAAGGELFDRIKLDCGTDENTARQYFRQLISGVAFCHLSGVCHRDLKPENLLLADNEELSTLKIADFGLSAIFAITENNGGQDVVGGGPGSTPVPTPASVQAIRRLRSVVGSPHYVAPEVLMDAGQGYDGAKADAWSIGVIVYAMLAGNLPFGKDLLKCLRYEKFKKWCYNTKYSDEDPIDEMIFPSWFFPPHFSLEVKSLITQLLYPDPTMRLSVDEAQRHSWVLGKTLPRKDISILENDPQAFPVPSDEPVPANSPAASSGQYRFGVVASAPQNMIDQEQQRWVPPPRPSPCATVNRLHHGRSPRQASTLCPPSPQTNLRGLQKMGRYMPSVDELAPLANQTPPISPRPAQDIEASQQCSADDVASSLTTSLQFPMDAVDVSATSQASQAGKSANDEDCEAHRVPSFTAAESAATTTQQRESVPHRLQRRFTSPPLATGSRSSLLQRHHQHRRNSPPELSFSRYGKGFKFEAIQTVFDLDSVNFQSSLALSPPQATATSTSESTASTAPSAVAADPPSYHDLVSRSTRFITSLPAQLVLSKIESILKTLPSPHPFPHTEAPQTVTINWESYQLEVRYGGVLTCSVQVFLFQRGVYLVEFCRGQVEIFQFKRFYEDIRERLSESMELSTHHQNHARTPRVDPFAATRDPGDQSQRRFPRKRNKSIGVHEDLLR